MYATAAHRDREARAIAHFRIDGLATAPKSVRRHNVRSARRAGAAALRDELFEALAERSAMQAA